MWAMSNRHCPHGGLDFENSQRVCALFQNDFADSLTLTLDVEAGSEVIGSDFYALEVEVFHGCVLVSGDAVDS